MPVFDLFHLWGFSLSVPTASRATYGMPVKPKLHGRKNKARLFNPISELLWSPLPRRVFQFIVPVTCLQRFAWSPQIVLGPSTMMDSIHQPEHQKIHFFQGAVVHYFGTNLKECSCDERNRADLHRFIFSLVFTGVQLDPGEGLVLCGWRIPSGLLARFASLCAQCENK